jgi:predicted transcriptional regulator
MQQLEETEERILFAIDEDGRLFGSVTNGDSRRGILANDSLEGRTEVMCNKHPLSSPRPTTMDDVRRAMLERNIACIPVVDDKERIVDLLFMPGIQVSFSRYRYRSRPDRRRGSIGTGSISIAATMTDSMHPIRR